MMAGQAGPAAGAGQWPLWFKSIGIDESLFFFFAQHSMVPKQRSLIEFARFGSDQAEQAARAAAREAKLARKNCVVVVRAGRHTKKSATGLCTGASAWMRTSTPTV